MWWGVLAPAGVPAAIVSRLNAEIGAILRDPESAKRLQADGAQPVVVTPAVFGTLIAADVAKWIKVARSAGISAH
jgi:tripartite-type tricarboxylate transporter receptor subunit TctC